ncbi:MAG: acyl--CoA ligase [Rhodospirillaceae bacterium]|nr:acyl--CoA ligase [Rhodospirillaceae bacterium]
MSGWAKQPTSAIRSEGWFGDRVVRTFVDRAPNYDAMIRRSVERFPDREALVFEDQRYTYRQLDQALDAVAANLVARGIKQGDRVGLYCGNHAAFFLASFGVLRLGAVAVPIGIRQQAPEIAYALDNCQATALIFDANAASRLPQASEIPSVAQRFSVEGSVAGAEPFEALLKPATAFKPVEIDQHDLAFIMYTSGTTGKPKGAMLTHANFVHSAMHFEICVGHTEKTRGLLAIPGSHISGLGAIVTEMLHVGGCIVVAREFKVRPCLELMVKEKVTFTVFVPTMYKLCLMEPDFDSFDVKSSWTVGLYGGAIMPEAVISLMAEKLPHLELVNGYGATETCSPATVTLPREATKYPDSIGKTVPLGDIKIMDENGLEVPRGEAGELWIGGPMVTKGYWNNPEATKANLVGGYWRSGDIGSMDEQGYVRIHDRKKDMINRAGFKVYSAEVENVLTFHPDVIECVVVARPDPVMGERVQAFVRSARAELSQEELRAFCSDKLADYKVPDVVRVTTEPLPRNNNGKLMKTVLRAQAEDEARKNPDMFARKRAAS